MHRDCASALYNYDFWSKHRIGGAAQRDPVAISFFSFSFSFSLSFSFFSSFLFPRRRITPPRPVPSSPAPPPPITALHNTTHQHHTTPPTSIKSNHISHHITSRPHHTHYAPHHTARRARTLAVIHLRYLSTPNIPSSNMARHHQCGPHGVVLSFAPL